MTSDRIRAAVLPFSCPTCLAPPGRPCTVRRGNRPAHLARQDKAIRAFNRSRS